MNVNAVNGETRRLQVLSVRLTDEELKRLQITLRNFHIEGSSVSEQLRILLDGAFTRSWKFKRGLKGEALITERWGKTLKRIKKEVAHEELTEEEAPEQ